MVTKTLRLVYLHSFTVQEDVGRHWKIEIGDIAWEEDLIWFNFVQSLQTSAPRVTFLKVRHLGELVESCEYMLNIYWEIPA